ncbi:hypothetical protein EE612_026630, partial [Oryza sativa]
CNGNVNAPPSPPIFAFSRRAAATSIPPPIDARIGSPPPPPSRLSRPHHHHGQQLGEPGDAVLRGRRRRWWARARSPRRRRRRRCVRRRRRRGGLQQHRSHSELRWTRCAGVRHPWRVAAVEPVDDGLHRRRRRRRRLRPQRRRAVHRVVVVRQLQLLLVPDAPAAAVLRATGVLHHVAVDVGRVVVAAARPAHRQADPQRHLRQPATPPVSGVQGAAAPRPPPQGGGVAAARRAVRLPRAGGARRHDQRRRRGEERRGEHQPERRRGGGGRRRGEGAVGARQGRGGQGARGGVGGARVDVRRHLRRLQWPRRHRLPRRQPVRGRVPRAQRRALGGRAGSTGGGGGGGAVQRVRRSGAAPRGARRDGAGAAADGGGVLRGGGGARGGVPGAGDDGVVRPRRADEGRRRVRHERRRQPRRAGAPGRAGPEAIKRQFDECEMGELAALQLTMDHSTNVYKEVRRIRSEHLDDPGCITNGRVKGCLKVTRAFGAGYLKEPRWNKALLEVFQVDYVGSSPYISCRPYIRHHRLGAQDKFLILSSDGLYDYFTKEEVVAQVEAFTAGYPDEDPAKYLSHQILLRAANQAGMGFHELLEIQQGDRRQYHDDVSIIIISLEGKIWRSSQ